MAAQTAIDIIINAKDNTKAAFGNLQRNLDKNKENLRAFGTQLDRAGKVGALALAGGLTLAAKSAIQFNKRLGDLSTLISGDSTKAIKGFEDGIKSLMKEVPVDPDELGESAYAIVSAGITDTADALEVLEEASKLGVAGLSTTAEATDILTSAMNSFGFESEDANKVSNILFETVQAGKTTVSELAMSFGATAPIVAEAGIELADFQAATAALTTTGLPASQAQNSLRQSIVALNKPTKEMQDLFKTIGVKSGKQLIETSSDLGDVFNKLSDAAEGDTEMLARAFGSVEALTAVTGVSSTVNEAYIKTLENLTDEVSSVDEGFKKQQETFGNQLQLVKNQFMPAFLDLGSALLDRVLPIVQTLTDAISGNEELIAKIVIPTLGAFVLAWGSVKAAMMIKTTVQGLTAAFRIMNATVAGKGGLTTSMGSLSGAFKVFAGAAVLGFTITQVTRAYQEFMNLKGATDDLNSSINTLKEVNDNASNSLDGVTNPARREEMQQMINKNNEWATAAQGVADRYSGINGIMNAILDTTRISNAQNAIFNFGKTIGSIAFGKKGNTGGVVTSSGIQKFQGGGVVKGVGNADTVPALLTPGEVVLNPRRGQMGGEITVNFNNAQVRSEQDLQSIIDTVSETLNRKTNLKALGV